MENPSPAGKPTNPTSGGGRTRGMVELARFGSDPLGYLDALRGDEREIVPFKIGSLHCNLVTNPDLILTVLESGKFPPFSRGRLAGLDRWYSGGLFMTEGAEHDRQRDGLWPPLVARSPTLDIAIDRTERRVGAWREDHEIELFEELRTLCWSIDWEALTGGDLDASPELLTAQERGFRSLAWLAGPFGETRWGLPLPSSLRVREARRRMDTAIDEMIAERRARADGEGATDLLSRLVQLADADGISDDEVIRANFKLRLSGDQLHGLLGWMLCLLATHPEIEARWHTELDEALGGRTPVPTDLKLLPYGRLMLKEALRLYPPIWGFFRALMDDYELGGTTIPAGEVIVLSPWFTQRDPRLWRNPLLFDPSRWRDGVKRPEGLAFFPFSVGPYRCQAIDLAPREAMLIITTICQKWSFRLPGGWVPKPVATNTIEIAPKGGLRMIPVRRA